MQYDRLLLELLNRVQILEDKVSVLESKNGSGIERSVGKYFKLGEYLKSADEDCVKLSLGKIEDLLGFDLPMSAKNHRAFWANTATHPISASWMSFGYEVSNVDMEIGEITFSKASVLQKAKTGKKFFFLNDEEFLIEIGYHDGRTFRLLKKTSSGFIDFEGNQKRFIVEKLRELKNENPNLDIDDTVKKFIDNYGPGNTQGQNSNKLAKLLYKLLPESVGEQNNEQKNTNEGSNQITLEKSQADKFRNFCNETYIIPARNRGEKTLIIRAGDVRNALNVRDKMPAICSSLQGKKFEKLANVRLVEKNTPPSGAGMNSYFIFEILPMN